MVRTLVTAALLLTAVASAAQTPAPVLTPSFDVVSVKESAPLPVSGGVTVRPGSPDPGGGAGAQDRASVTFFIASDCPISNAYAPAIATVCRSYAAKGVSCTLAYEDARIDAAGVSKHAGDYHLRGIPTTTDTSRALADRARVEITPTAVVSDSNGHVRYQGRIDNLYINIGRTRQVVTSHDLTDALDAVLAGKAVRQPHTEALGCYIERR